MKKTRRVKFNKWGGWWDCLGFAPRSQSFAFELAVQVGSISSLSCINAVRKSARTPQNACAF
ncbi:hypothetical protein IJ596_06690 [bacterium]|nr:hypothetical protein [bacterium]